MHCGSFSANPLTSIYVVRPFQVSIPEKKTKTKDPNKAPEFVYNVMGQYV